MTKTNINDIEPATLYEVSQLREDAGLEGEQDTHLVVFLGFLGGGFIVMTGLSSGGKDEVVDAAEYCVPDNWVYQIPTSMSKTVLYGDSKNINSCPVHRHKDISNIQGKDWLEDIWKRHGDGRSISHSYTDVKGEERTQVTETIHPPNCMILFLASDNQQVDLNDYAEVQNRALVVGIDDSQELTEQVNTRQAREAAGYTDFNISEERTEEIRRYVASIPMHQYGDDGAGGILNPVMPAMDKQNPLPQHFTEARRDFKRLDDFIRSVTLFHYQDRITVPQKMWSGDNRIENDTTMLVTPADAWMGMRVFGEKMILSALNLQDKHFALLDVIRSNYGEQFDPSTLRERLRQQGWNITPSDVKAALKDMLEKNYVRVDKTVSPHEWTASEFANEAALSREVNLDWPSLIEDMREEIHENYPTPIATDYEKRFLQGDGLLVTHPFDGHTVNLSEQEANELEETVEEQQEKEEQAFGQGTLGQ